MVTLPAGHLAIYRTNGGATTSFGIAVRQECRILPGLLRVRDVWDAYPAYEVRTQVLAPDRVQFSSPAYGDRPPGEIVEEVSLKPLWCPAAGQQGLAADTSQMGALESGSLLAINHCGFGVAGQRWLVQLKPEPLGRRRRMGDGI